MGFDHAFHSDVIMTLAYSNNLRLTFGCLHVIRFENKQSDLIVRCREGKHLKLEIIVYHLSQSLLFLC